MLAINEVKAKNIPDRYYSISQTIFKVYNRGISMRVSIGFFQRILAYNTTKIADFKRIFMF